MTQYQVRFLQIPRWLAAIVGLLAIAFAVALFLLSLTIFLLLLPALVVAGALYYFFGLPRTARKGAADTRVIDAEYRVIEPDAKAIEQERRGPQ
jgi:hypothetical protein